MFMHLIFSTYPIFIDHFVLTHSSVRGHLSYFHPPATVKNSGIQISPLRSWFNSSQLYTWVLFFQGSTTLFSLAAVPAVEFQFLHIFTNTCFFNFCHNCHMNSVRWPNTVVLNCDAWVTGDTENLFIHLSFISTFSLRNVYSVCCPLFSKLSWPFRYWSGGKLHTV